MTNCTDKAGIPASGGWNWPSREQWAKNRRTWYGDDPNPLAQRNRASDFASAAEIEQAISELKAHWKLLGRQMTEAKRFAGKLLQQPGETSYEYITRWLEMPKAAQDLAIQPDHLRRDRAAIHFTIRELGDRDGRLHWRVHNVVVMEPSPSPTLCRIWSRYEDALDDANKAFAEQIAQTPIDDAAWEEELERRAEFEAEF